MATASQTEATGDLLCLILDLNPIAWALSGQVSSDGDELSLEAALDQVIIFCNAHLALRHENELAVFAAGFGKSRLLFSSQLTPLTSSTPSTSADRDSNTYQQFRLVDEKIALGVREVMAVLPSESGEGTVGLVGALSMALCHVNRLAATDSLSTSLSKAKPRICIISVTEDSSSQYVPIMNCIFSAQKVVRSTFLLFLQARSLMFFISNSRIFQSMSASYMGQMRCFYSKPVTLRQAPTTKSHAGMGYFSTCLWLSSLAQPLESNSTNLRKIKSTFAPHAFVTSASSILVTLLFSSAGLHDLSYQIPDVDA
ncbi:transcription initiation factor TFIIH subunit 3, partial [Phenoliferia sp. Uapishka_3]